MAILTDFNEDEKTNQIPANPSQESQSQQLQPIKPSSDAAEDDQTREQEEEDQKPKPLLPNKANGLDMENYSWGQSLQEININVSVPPGTKASFVSVDIKTDRIKIGFKNQDPLLEGHLFKGVKVQDCFWSLEDKKTVSVLLTNIDRMDWWKSLLKGGPEINTQKVEPAPSRLSELDLVKIHY